MNADTEPEKLKDFLKTPRTNRDIAVFIFGPQVDKPADHFALVSNYLESRSWEDLFQYGKRDDGAWGWGCVNG